VPPHAGTSLSADAVRGLILDLVGRSKFRLYQRVREGLTADDVRGLTQLINGFIAYPLTATERRTRVKDVDTFLEYLRSLRADLDPHIAELRRQREGDPVDARPRPGYDRAYDRRAAKRHWRDVELRFFGAARRDLHERLSPIISWLELWRHQLGGHPVSGARSQWAPMALSIAEALLGVLRGVAYRCGEPVPKGYGRHDGLIVRFVRAALKHILPYEPQPSRRAILRLLERVRKEKEASRQR
jgi:hypothetical protein